MLQTIINRANEIAKYANKTPILTSSTINQMTDAKIFFKCENFQKGGAFKFRGALNTILQLTEDEKKRGIIAHSSGNHAQAVAIVGRLLGIKTTIVMPKNASSVKIAATKGYGATVVFSDIDIKSREETCQQLIDKYNYVLIHPYDNQNIIIGAASTAFEITEEIGELDYIITPIGGGGLISGTGLYSKLSGKIKYVIGSEPELADDAYLSLKTGKLQPAKPPKTIADGLLTHLSELTFNHVTKYVDDIITVSEEEIINAMKLIWERLKIIIEPSSAVPVAALFKGIENGIIKRKSRVGIIISGGNVDLSNYFNELNKKIKDP